VTAEGTDFAFGGRLCLDLTWTLRYRSIAPTEVLREPADLGRWITVALAPMTEPVAPGLLGEAVRLREAIHAAARAVIAGRAIARADRAVINETAMAPGPQHRLDTNGEVAVDLRPGAEVESALAAIATDAIELLATRDGRLRACAGPDCSLLFHDSSRPGRRRWCAAARCGNRVNTAAYRRRRADGPTEL